MTIRILKIALGECKKCGIFPLDDLVLLMISDRLALRRFTYRQAIDRRVLSRPYGEATLAHDDEIRPTALSHLQRTDPEAR
jgi:hypothetical protein